MTLQRWQADDADIGYWKAPDGWPIRTACWRAASAKGTIFFLNGRGDFVEKYAETCRQWAASGYTVMTWDWRGQGLSGRMFGETSRTHLESFAPLVEDALGMLRDPALARLPKPWFVCAHSLGGHLALRILHDAPGVFAKAVLLAPMLGLNAGPLPPGLAQRFVRLMVSAGQGRRFALGQTPYGAMTRSRFRQLRLTSDAARFQDESDAIAANPALAIGGVTFGWVNAAFQSLNIIAAPGYVSSIQTPTLMLLAGREQIVDSHAAAEIGKLLPHGRVAWINAAAHELLREQDIIRNEVIVIIDEFLNFVGK